MQDPDLDAYKAAATSLGDDDFTKGGAPKMAPLNAALNEAGFRDITADERDAFEDAVIDEAVTDPVTIEDPLPQTENAPDGWVCVCLIESGADPLPLYVHGLGHFSLRVGVPGTLPEEALDALNHVSGITYTLEC